MPAALGPLEGIRIAGSGTALPSELGCAVPGRLDSAGVYARLLGADWSGELARRGLDPPKAERDWGIAAREWSADPRALREGLAPTCGALELAALAARRALEDARLAPADVDWLIAATSTPAAISSALAPRIARALEAEPGAFDVRAGGAGGLEAWLVGASLVAAGARRALVVASEVPSHYVDPADLATALVYGDGAAALVLERASGAGGLVAARAGSSAIEGRPFTVPGALPPRADELALGRYAFQRPDATYRAGLDQCWQRALESLRTAAAGAPIDLFAPYAVTAGQVASAARALGVAETRVATALGEHGCQGSAGPLFALHEARLEGRLPAGALLATAAVAGGVAWCGLLWRI